MGGVYKCDRFGALGHKAATCSALNAFAGHELLAVHTATRPGSAGLPVCTPTSSPP